jgi:hypothetical protein
MHRSFDHLTSAERKTIMKWWGINLITYSLLAIGILVVGASHRSGDTLEAIATGADPTSVVLLRTPSARIQPQSTH